EPAMVPPSPHCLPGRSMPKPLTIAAILLLAALPTLLAQGEEKPQPKTADKPFARSSEVRRILETHCVSCHGGKTTRAGLDLTARDRLLRGGRSGKAVVPGKSQKSRLYKRITHAETPGMPYKRERLSKSQIALLAAWMDAGVPYDRPLKKQ